MNNSYKNVFVVLDEYVPVFASPYRATAQAFIDNEMLKSRNSYLKEWGNDDPSEKDLMEANGQADTFEMRRCNLSGVDYDDTIELDNGMEIDASDIFDLLKESDEYED